MSFDAVKWARGKTVGGTAAKSVLVELALLANDEGFAFPGTKWLAVACECSVRTVVRSLQLLVEAGLITRERRVDVRGHRAHDGFLLALGDLLSGDRPDVPKRQSGNNNKKKESTNESRSAQSTEPRTAARPMSPRRPSRLPEAPVDSDKTSVSALTEPELFSLLESESLRGSVPRNKSQEWFFPTARVEHCRSMLRTRQHARGSGPQPVLPSDEIDQSVPVGHWRSDENDAPRPASSERNILSGEP